MEKNCNIQIIKKLAHVWKLKWWKSLKCLIWEVFHHLHISSKILNMSRMNYSWIYYIRFIHEVSSKRDGIVGLILLWEKTSIKSSLACCYFHNHNMLLQILANQLIHSFFVGCLNPGLQGTSVRVGSLQPWLRVFICIIMLHRVKKNGA